ncbi:nose resistant to fluoxetine protein 6-like [Elysia marginata]|uniref:Nose resistant to fluoxetine protein 6-like n=1 Tax=Elysia marginata TaxID=1093978 RepID=A0AAV4GQP4_9GAST|nr:nose resistant to fluoxetine protein 6-like [Elysia marginata]
MPDTCTDTENTLFLSEALKFLGVDGNFTALQAESHTDKREATAATVTAIIIICILAMMMIVGTAYDVIFLQWPKWRVQWQQKEEEKNKMSLFTANGGDIASMPQQTQGVDDDEPLIIKNDIQQPTLAPRGKLVKALLAFSVYTNGSKVLNTSQPPGAISCIHGIRFLSMTWVILGHLFAFGIQDIDNLASEVPILLSRWTFDAIANAFVSVDSFFTLSGLLVAYVTVTEMKKRNGWNLNWGLFYFHRFWRSCFSHSWYLSNDMQFFLVSPLMLIPFYFNTFLGLASCGIFFLTHIITTGVLSAQHKWGATLISAAADGGLASYFQDYYEAPWCRIGPYIVGIVTGYFLATKRDKIKLTWLRATIGWVVATAVALAVLYGLRGDIKGDHRSSVSTAALYNALARSAWGACVCWVIVACVTGWGGFVNTLLSWSPFVVLGRLTYMAYLFHISLIAIFFGNQDTLFHLNGFNIAVLFLGVVVATYGISFVLMLALESPMIGLEKVFLPQRRKD